MTEMNAADLRAYAARRWHLVAGSKIEHWALELARRGLPATFEASGALRAHMCRVRPDWPAERERQEDLAHHIVLRRAIDRAAGAFVSAARR